MPVSMIAPFERRQLAENFDLIWDVNAPEVRTETLAESRRDLGSILGEPQPVGGMSGQVTPPAWSCSAHAA